MADYGVTPNGFVRIRRPELEKSIIDDVNRRLVEIGITEQISGDVSSVSGVIVQVCADKLAEIWEVMQGVYLAMYPNTATGASLDFSASYTGVRRLPATPSIASITVTGQEGAIIPLNTEINNSRTGAIWRTTEAKEITRETATGATFRIDQAKSNAEYSITLDGVQYAHTTPATAVPNTIISAILVQLPPTIYESTQQGQNFTIRRIDETAIKIGEVSPTLTLESLEIEIPSSAVSDPLDVANRGELADFRGSLSKVDSVTNRSSGKNGTRAETDEQLRKRYMMGVYRTGAGTFPSLEPNMRMVANVRDVAVFENDTDEIKDGMKPHSVYYVVLGGTDEDVANEIANRKGAGIDTNGAVSYVLKRKYGDITIRFDRPKPVYIWLLVSIEMFSNAQPISDQDLKNKILERGDEYGIGASIPPNRLSCGLYNENIKNIEIRYATSATPDQEPAEYKDGLIPIARTELPVFDTARIRLEIKRDA